MFGMAGVVASSLSPPAKTGLAHTTASRTIAMQPVAFFHRRRPQLTPAPPTSRVITKTLNQSERTPADSARSTDRSSKQKARRRFRRGPYVFRDDGLIALGRPTRQAGFDNSELTLGGVLGRRHHPAR